MFDLEIRTKGGERPLFVALADWDWAQTRAWLPSSHMGIATVMGAEEAAQHTSGHVPVWPSQVGRGGSWVPSR